VPQVISYVVFLILVVLFYAVLVPHLQAGRTVLAVLFSLALLAMATATLISSFIDPSDPAMVMFRTDRPKYPSFRS
jgi:uncharacterized membrane protein YhhN